MIVRLKPLFRSPYFFVLAIFVLTLSLTCYPIQSDDLFMYLALAKNFFKSGAFPSVDPFVYAKQLNSSIVVLHQWLGYFIYYFLYICGGFNLIILFKTGLIAFGLFLPLFFLRRRTDYFIWGLSVFLSVYAMGFRLMERTSLFSDIRILTLLLILLLESKKPSRLKFLIPFLFLFWVNIHPIFPMGWFLCGLFLVCQLPKRASVEFKQFLIITIISIAICFLNPKGWAGVLYPFQFAGAEGAIFRQYYFEWMPTLGPLFINRAHTLFLGLLIALNICLLYRNRKDKPYFEAMTSLFFIFYGLYAIRFVPSLCFTLTVLNAFLSLKLPEVSKIKNLSLALAVLALSLGIKNIFWGYETISGERHFGLGLDSRVIPENAAKFILQHPQIGNVFNSHQFGSYLIWAWQGQRKVFYHGFVTDTDFFLNEYAPFMKSNEQLQKQIENHHIAAFILDRFFGNGNLIKNLAQNPNWVLVFQDESSLVFLPR